MELSSMSRPELLRLRKQVETELASRRKHDHRSARRELKDVAEKYGVSLADLVTGFTVESNTPRGELAYRHPENPDLGWSGRGRKPNWLKEWEARGGSLDQLRR